MDIENLKELRTFMQSEENLVGFNMARWFTHNNQKMCVKDDILKIVDTHPCGTVACIAGHAAILAWRKPGYCQDNSIYYTAKNFLNLTLPEADRLFMGYWTTSSVEEITKDQAIAELTRLIERETENLHT